MNAKRRSVWTLAVVVAGMFGFGYALVPLYRTICEVTGLNGKSDSLVSKQALTEREDASRLVTVQFLTSVNGARTWSFEPEQRQIQVHPGKLYTVYFTARNEQEQDVVGQAVPSVAPWLAANHLHKTECFCFTRQPFKALEEKRMPVRFMLDRDLPRDVDTVTLSYTFFDVTQLAQKPNANSPNS
jgi:cytochrome c oxidase assembly protein subunit 11